MFSNNNCSIVGTSMSKGITLLLLAACLSGSANAAGAMEITKSNFDELTKGKIFFIKFLAPW
jgi:hypothetical protein